MFDLSDRTSYKHLLDSNNSEDNFNNGAHVIKHSPYYGETDFSKLLVHKAGFSILSLNIQSVNAKFDELQLFVNSRRAKLGQIQGGLQRASQDSSKGGLQ